VFFDLGVLNYPRAAANSIILLIIVVLIAAGILRIVDVRKELTG
jgi:putative spermidine/putrescine transport system permease protein